MADATFEQLWRRVLVYAPECPIPLAQEWINTAYSRFLNWHYWSTNRAEFEVSIPAPYSTGTVSYTLGSPNIVGSGTLWSSQTGPSLLNQQFYLGGIAPFYTIATITDDTHITLDRNITLPTASAQTYTISQVYVEMPSDFQQLTDCVDRVNNWRLHLNFTQEHLDIWDSKRSFSGVSWILAAAAPRIPTSTNIPVVRYEFWPRVLSGPKQYGFRYVRLPALMSAPTDRPIFPCRGDILRAGALSQAAMWPGTSSIKNPYFGLEQHRMMEDEFRKLVHDEWRIDQEIRQTAIEYNTWDKYPFYPVDSNFLQSHDVLMI